MEYYRDIVKGSLMGICRVGSRGVVERIISFLFFFGFYGLEAFLVWWYYLVIVLIVKVFKENCDKGK